MRGGGAAARPRLSSHMLSLCLYLFEGARFIYQKQMHQIRALCTCFRLLYNHLDVAWALGQFSLHHLTDFVGRGSRRQAQTRRYRLDVLCDQSSRVQG